MGAPMLHAQAVLEKAGRPRDAAVLALSALAHGAILLAAIGVYGSPKLLATTPPETIVVDIVPPEEVTNGEWGSAQPPAEPQTQAKPQAQPQPVGQPQPPAQPQTQAKAQAPQPQEQARAQAQPQPQTKPVPAATGTAPMFTSLYPWPVTPGRPPGDPQTGDYRTFEATEKAEAQDDLAALKARLKACWRPPVVDGGAKKLSAALRVRLKLDGSLAGPPELVEATASPYGPALVDSALRAVNQCGPYGFLSADGYDTWKSLSLTFSPDDVKIAAVVR